MRFLKRTTATALGAILVFGLFAVNETSAQEIERQVIGSGATMIYDGSGNPVLLGTVGQTIIGVSGYEANQVDLYHGFWYMPVDGPSSTPDEPVPGEATHLWNSPNPFTSTTTIHYEIPSRSLVRLRVYDMAGNLVKTLVDGNVGQGLQNVVWDGKTETGESAATGYYYYTLDAQPTDTRGQAVSYRQKMLLMK